MITPTFSELYESTKSDLRNKLGISTIVGKMVLLAFSAVQAAKLKIFYLAVGLVYKNVFVDQCDNDTILRFGLVKLNRLPRAAIAGEYNITVAGNIGAVIPPGTMYKSLDSSSNPGKLFIADSTFTFTAPTGVILIRALDGGNVSLLQTGDQLQVTSPIALVDSFATVFAVSVVPVEAESIDNYRIAVIEAYRTEPQGGAKTDYQLWSKDAAGVRRVYPYVTNGTPGDIDIFVEALVDDSTDGKGTPSAGILSDVEDVIEFDPDTTRPIEERGRRPMGVFDIHIYAITPIDIDIEITDLSPTVSLTAIENAIRSFIYNIRPFVDGGDDPSGRNDKIFEADMYRIVRDLLVGSESFTSIQMSVSGTPESIHLFENGDIPYLNSVTSV